VRTPERLAAVQAERTDEAIAQQYVGDPEGEFTCCIFRHRRSVFRLSRELVVPPAL